MKIQGIYQIRNIFNNKVYIGSSSDVKNRWLKHKNELNKNNHNNIYLQRAWDKYGKDTFVFEIIEDIRGKDPLLIREQWFLDNVIRWDFDYNMARDATAPMKGRKHSPETRKIQSEAKTGEKNHRFGKTGDKCQNWGRHHSDKTKKRMSEFKTGEKTHTSKLTETDVLKIREMWKTGKYTYKKLGDMFGVTGTNVSRIIHRKTWKHI